MTLKTGAMAHRNQLHLKKNQCFVIISNNTFKNVILLFYCTFNPVNAAFVSIRDFYQTFDRYTHNSI